VLSISGLCSSYGEAQVLHGVSLDVKAGEVVALLGRNGMGKTSLVRTVMGLGSPQKTSGEIFMDGVSLEGLPPYKVSQQKIGYVPQGRRLFPSLSVLEHLSVLDKGLKAENGAWSIQQVFEAFPRLRERIHHKGNQLSGGERQMLAIGRSLMMGPSVLLMDEPTEGLDPVMVGYVENILKKLKASGLGILLVEQNLYSALAVADRVLIMETGALVWSGLPSELLNNEETLRKYLGVH
jgi:branched-chain amino acid transport system ATP-binding protein